MHWFQFAACKSATFAKKRTVNTFELTGHDFIQLNQLLKLLNWADSGGEANQAIVSGRVLLNGTTELQKRKKLFAGDRVKYNGNEILIVAGK